MNRHRRTSIGCAAFVVCVELVAFWGADSAWAGDVKAGSQKAQEVCAVCHGLDGVSKIAEAPNLAGQNEQYLIAQLVAFQSGARNNEMMSIVIKNLSQADIENLAAYYAAIPITVGTPPQQ
jgi:cytochrome c553